MTASEETRYCRLCERRTVHQIEEPEWMVHIALTALTAGLWAFVLFGIALFGRREAACVECGTVQEVKGTRVGRGRSSGKMYLKCRICSEPVEKGIGRCPHCGADRPTEWRP